jgi:hypothetical protein
MRLELVLVVQRFFDRCERAECFTPTLSNHNGVLEVGGRLFVSRGDFPFIEGSDVA